MVIEGWVRECDFTGVKYDEAVEGAHFLCRGATGRVCCVMHAGPEYVAENGIQFNTRTEAEEWAVSVPGGSVDF